MAIEHIDDQPEPASGPDLLRQFLLARDVECPGCGYNLRGLRGGACPECNEELVLRVSLSEPRAGAFISGLIALACGAGGFALSLGWLVLMTLMHGPAPSAMLYVVPAVGLAVEAPALWGWASARGRRRIRSLTSRQRMWAAAACWGATLVLFGMFIAAFSRV